MRQRSYRFAGWLAVLVLWVGTGAVCLGQGATGSSAGAAKAGQTISQKPAASQALLDINTATPDQLKALPGIGDAYAKRIVDGRPYTAKNQLVQRGILPANTYDKIKAQIVAHRPKK